MTEGAPFTAEQFAPVHGTAVPCTGVGFAAGPRGCPVQGPGSGAWCECPVQVPLISSESPVRHSAAFITGRSETFAFRSMKKDSRRVGICEDSLMSK
ncbi:hypothetical protein SAMN05428954_1137 [Streptomyces sp. 2112.3]|nr:hypothetical protein SAMN05428954_1137 [Streptomyces sp. 2112.3]